MLVDPKALFAPYPNRQNSQLGPQKDKNNPKIMPNKVRNEGSIENKSCSAIGVDPENVFKPYPNLNKND